MEKKKSSGDGTENFGDSRTEKDHGVQRLQTGFLCVLFAFGPLYVRFKVQHQEYRGGLSISVNCYFLPYLNRSQKY